MRTPEALDLRSFVAIEIPEAIRRLVSSRVERIAGTLPPARWVRPGNYHLTLRFLGEVEESRLRDLQSALLPVFSRTAPFSLQVGSAGAFPVGKPARVAWLGVVDDGSLGPLAAEVGRACEPFAERSEKRRFSAHLTLARCRRPWPMKAVDSWRAAFSESTIGNSFPVTHGVLMSSRLGRRGPGYEVIAALPIGENR